MWARAFVNLGKISNPIFGFSNNTDPHPLRAFDDYARSLHRAIVEINSTNFSQQFGLGRIDANCKKATDEARKAAVKAA
jgi:hypothetical protein